MATTEDARRRGVFISHTYSLGLSAADADEVRSTLLAPDFE